MTLLELFKSISVHSEEKTEELLKYDYYDWIEEYYTHEFICHISEVRKLSGKINNFVYHRESGYLICNCDCNHCSIIRMLSYLLHKDHNIGDWQDEDYLIDNSLGFHLSSCSSNIYLIKGFILTAQEKMAFKEFNFIKEEDYA